MTSLLASTLALVVTMSCDPPPPEAPVPPKTCSAAYPNGIGADIASKSFLIAVDLRSNYELRDANLAHDQFPALLLDALNGAAAGTGTTFRLADGTYANLTFDITLTSDETGDHYGAYVKVSGSEGMSAQGTMTPSAAVWLFDFTLPTTFVTGQKLIGELAAQSVRRVVHGWRCP